MFVRDGMNRTVVTVGPGHTLREAARLMTDAGVGAAVVIDPDGEGPCIITERDLLHASGCGEDPDRELVVEHMRERLVYTAPDWPLERAAEAMVLAQFRHTVVLDEGHVVGILSMRDIVRLLVESGALRQNERLATENSMGSEAVL